MLVSKNEVTPFASFKMIALPAVLVLRKLLPPRIPAVPVLTMVALPAVLLSMNCVRPSLLVIRAVPALLVLTKLTTPRMEALTPVVVIVAFPAVNCC